MKVNIDTNIYLKNIHTGDYFQGCSNGHVIFGAGAGVDVKVYDFYDWEINLLNQMNLKIENRVINISEVK